MLRHADTLLHDALHDEARGVGVEDLLPKVVLHRDHEERNGVAEVQLALPRSPYELSHFAEDVPRLRGEGPDELVLVFAVERPEGALPKNHAQGWIVAHGLGAWGYWRGHRTPPSLRLTEANSGSEET